jgi:hypothetical protein
MIYDACIISGPPLFHPLQGTKPLLIPYFSIMIRIISLLIGLGMLVQCNPKSTELFNGQTFEGWEGDTVKTWRISDGAIIGGSLTDTVPHNDFLCTEKEYSDFVLKLRFKIVGNGGFINAGVQFRSQRLKEPAYEMTGYQADLGAGYWGSLYDESRRNKVLAFADSLTVQKTLKPDDWNDYEIHAEGKRIRLYINGQQTVDYTEPDESIPQAGVIGLQVHGGGKLEVYYRDIVIKELE